MDKVSLLWIHVKYDHAHLVDGWLVSWTEMQGKWKRQLLRISKSLSWTRGHLRVHSLKHGLKLNEGVWASASTKIWNMPTHESCHPRHTFKHIHGPKSDSNALALECAGELVKVNWPKSKPVTPIMEDITDTMHLTLNEIEMLHLNFLPRNFDVLSCLCGLKMICMCTTYVVYVDTLYTFIQVVVRQIFVALTIPGTFLSLHCTTSTHSHIPSKDESIQRMKTPRQFLPLFSWPKYKNFITLPLTYSGSLSPSFAFRFRKSCGTPTKRTPFKGSKSDTIC